MLDAYLTEEVFRRGLREYIKKFAYGNAVTTDLWECLSEASGGKPVRQMMECWTRQTGYPVVFVKVAADGGLLLSQAKFLATGADASDKTKWIVPLRALPQSLAEGAPEVLDMPEATVARGEGAFVKLNAGQKGFYRVSYGAELVEELC